MDVCLQAQFWKVPICRSACKIACKMGKSSVGPDGGGALPEGSAAEGPLCLFCSRCLSALYVVLTAKLGALGVIRRTYLKLEEESKSHGVSSKLCARTVTRHAPPPTSETHSTI